MLNDIKTGFGDERSVVIRLTALWALSEAGLGGLMHLLKSPFTGIFVGGVAVILIALIAYFAEKPAVAIPRALMVVLIIKALVSPHSPLPAYFALTFQGLVGAVLFGAIPSFRLAALLLGALALLESAVQKLLVMTLLFGKPLWKSIDAFVDYVLEKMGVLAQGGSVQGSLWLVGAYVGSYWVSGLVVGWLAGRLPEKIQLAATTLVLPQVLEVDDMQAKPGANKPFWKRKPIWMTALTVGALLLVYAWVPAAKPILSPLWLLLRVVGLIAFWYLVVGRLLGHLLRRFLRQKATQYEADVSAALDLLPVFRALSRSAWTETQGLRGWRRGRELIIRIITYALLYTKRRI